MEAGAGSERKRTPRVGKSLAQAERKAFSDFVACAGGREDALVKKKFMGGKPGEVRLAANFCFEFSKSAFLAFCARQSDMGLVRTRFLDETARLGCCGDAFLKQEQLRRDTDSRKENSGAIEAAKPFKTNGNRRRVERAQTRDQACVLLRVGIAQELQGDVP